MTFEIGSHVSSGSITFLGKNLMLSKFILWLFSIALVIGAFDYFCGNKWKLGEKFTQGLRAFEPLFLTMAGILILLPFFRKILAPAVAPLFSRIGVDPAIFAGSILANDMGGFQLAHTLSDNPSAADFGGMLIASVLGVNFTFTLPTAIRMIEKDDHAYLFRGLLYGFITLPIGCFLGGLSAGYDFIWILWQLIPVAIISLLSGIFLIVIPHRLTVMLSRLGRFIEALALIGVVLGITLEITGGTGGDISWLDSVGNAIAVVGAIVIMLPGAYVLIELVYRACRPLLSRIGKKIHINETSVLGLLSTLVNDIPTFQMIKKMDSRGKILNTAFLTAGAFAFGDHLAFCCALAPKLVFPLLVTKLSGAISAAALFLIIEYSSPLLPQRFSGRAMR